jgi:iron complex transport system ATP-binding protein
LKAIYEIKKVNTSYNGGLVLKDVSFSVRSGEFISIVGPNGAGKSTLLKIMVGLMKPESGRVLYDGKPLGEHNPRMLAQKVGYLPQVNELSFSYRCYDMVMIGRTPYLSGLMLGGKNDREIVKKVMDDTDCLQFVEKDINAISAGERQRVFIARALAVEPQVLLLDEAVSSLDLEHAVSIYRLLRDLNERKKITIVSVLHNLNITSQFSDRVIMLHGGEVLSDGIPAEVLKKSLLRVVYGDSFDILTSKKTGRPIVIPRRS